MFFKAAELQEEDENLQIKFGIVVKEKHNKIFVLKNSKTQSPEWNTENMMK